MKTQDNKVHIELPLEPPEDEVTARCTVCGENIYKGEYYGYGGDCKICCIDCLESEWNGLYDREKFEALGYEVVI